MTSGGGRLIRLLLLTGCLPSMVLNVGSGRSLLIHHHPQEPVHTHIVASSHKHDHADLHRHWHRHGHEADHEPGPRQGGQGSSEESSQTVIRGAEVPPPRGQDAGAAAGGASLALVPPLWFEPAPVPPLSSEPAHPPNGPVPQGGLACLRGVVLLI